MQMHQFTLGGLFNPLELCGVGLHFIMDGCTFIGFENLKSINIIPLCHYKVRKSQDKKIFSYCIRTRCIYTLDVLRVSNSWDNVHFWVNYPFKRYFGGAVTRPLLQ